MTELLNTNSLRCAEPVPEPADVSVRLSIPVRLQRGIDSETGRAVSFWTPAEKASVSRIVCIDLTFR